MRSVWFSGCQEIYLKKTDILTSIWKSQRKILSGCAQIVSSPCFPGYQQVCCSWLTVHLQGNFSMPSSGRSLRGPTPQRTATEKKFCPAYGAQLFWRSIFLIGSRFVDCKKHKKYVERTMISAWKEQLAGCSKSYWSFMFSLLPLTSCTVNVKWTGVMSQRFQRSQWPAAWALGAWLFEALPGL